jgi:hypothetical protein
MSFRDDDEFALSPSSHPEKSQAQRKREELKKMLRKQKGREIDEQEINVQTDEELSGLRSKLAGESDEETKRSQNKKDEKDQELFDFGPETLMEEEERKKEIGKATADAIIEQEKIDREEAEQAEEEYTSDSI